MDLQVSIARGHPRSATESYKKTLKRIEFNEEEYHMALHLPNVDFVSQTVEELISVLLPKVYDITNKNNT
jgi:4'-phosphopantetheinyl transferase